jgi:tryptophan 2,3-dioxygenase
MATLPADDYSEPVLPGSAASDYERYLRTDELLALQKRPEEMVHRDELLFQVVHQSSELWLKLAASELEEATASIGRAELGGALRSLRRVVLCLRFVTDQLDMLEHMSPWEYTEIRRVLGHGSGFDSPGFNRLRAAAPPLGQAYFGLVRARGLSLVDVYRRGRELEDLYQLAESLLEVDERLTAWRVRHLQVIVRAIGGGAVGTQGTPVELLAGLVKHRLYPELWDVRDRLTEIAFPSA